MLERINQFFNRLPPWALLLLAGALLLLVGYVDGVTGPELSFAHFYLIPLCLVTWRLGAAWGYATAVASAMVGLWAEHMGAAVYTSELSQEWNLLTRLAFFIASVFILSSWRSVGTKLASMVEERTTALREEISQRETAQNQLRTLAAQLSAAEDAERRKLAYEIHDGLSQILSLVKINLDAAVLEVAGGTPLQSRLGECARSVDELLRQTRTLTFDLHPAMLDDLGLGATLHRYARELKQRTGMEVTVTEHGLRRPVGSPLVNYLFRSIKELASNALKHGRAREVIVGIHWETSGLRVVVDDDGGGFDARLALTPESRRGLGLAGIEERLTSFGGRLNIESNIGQGSRIILEVPLRSESNREEIHDDASLAG